MWILLDIQIEKDLISSDLLILAQICSHKLRFAQISSHLHRCKYRLIVKNSHELIKIELFQVCDVEIDHGSCLSCVNRPEEKSANSRPKVFF